MKPSAAIRISGLTLSIYFLAYLAISVASDTRRNTRQVFAGTAFTKALDSLEGLEIQAVHGNGLDPVKATADVATYSGRRALHLLNDDSGIVKGNASGGESLAIVKGSDFKDGTIEVDVVGWPREGARPDTRGFVGLAFRVQDHGSRFEAFYLRFTNGRAEDQLRRNHSAQYVSEPDFPWFRLRKENPGEYESPAGNVVIDTAPAKEAAEAKRVLAEEIRGPMKYIILTHGHADHIGGIDLWKEPGTQIIAQRNYVEFLNYVTRLEGFFTPRNAVAFNRPTHEVGPWAGNFGAKIDPTIFFDQNYKFTLGGIEFQLFSTPGETPDHLTVWIPAYKAAFIGDNYSGAGLPEPNSFPNIYAIRGTKPRWALDWIASLDKVLELKPDLVLNGHGDPIIGNEEITRRLSRYRDAIQFVHDETVKGMNAGKDVFTLMQEIKLPVKFNLTESFGKVSWSVRGIYEGYAGWYDGNPTSMYELPADSVYPDLVKLAGGPEPLVRLALEKIGAGKPVEALHLTDVVLAYDGENKGALDARIKALESLQKGCENFVEEGWLENGITKVKQKLGSAN